MAVSWRKDGTCGFVVLDNPPVNAINRKIRQGLLDAVDWAERERLDRVIYQVPDLPLQLVLT